MNVALVALQSPVAPPCCHSCDRTSVNESGRRRLSLVLKGCDDPIPGTGVATPIQTAVTVFSDASYAMEILRRTSTYSFAVLWV